MVTGASVSLFPTDDVAPYFKTEPVRTQVHLEGNRLVLTCMAEGSWPLEFKWLHNDRELTKFSLEYRQARRPFPPSGPPGSCRVLEGHLNGERAGLAARGSSGPGLQGGWDGGSCRGLGGAGGGGSRQPCPGVRRPCGCQQRMTRGWAGGATPIGWSGQPWTGQR